MSGREHGTRTKYVHDRCRCADCRDAMRTYERWRIRQRAYGRTPYVDAEPVRAHIRAVMAQGLGWERAARQAGLASSVVWKLLYGHPQRGLAPSKRVRRRTAAALLAVRVDLDTLADGARVPAIGTQRRLRALVALGWSMSELARRLDRARENFGRTVMETTAVNVATARAVRDLYDQLWDTPPAEDSRVVRYSASRARNFAAARGWPPPLAWDDDTIDDPTAVPLHDARGVDRPNRLVDLAEVEHLAEHGAHKTEIARRLGVSVDAIANARRKARQAAS